MSWKISELPSALSLEGDEYFEITQDGTSKKITAQTFAQYTTAGGAGAPLRIGVIGDSFSQSSTRNESWCEQTCRILSQLLGVPVVLRNVAIGGSTWESAYTEDQHKGGTATQVEEIIEFQPQILFIALGFNDMRGSATATQVLSVATSIKNDINAALPLCKIVYVEQLPHNIDQGLNPTSLTNANAVPDSHAVITYKGLSNVRVNNTTYLNTNLSSGKLNRHKEWGLFTTTLRTLFDGYFTIDLWKLCRMGCRADTLHLDELGHTLWAWKAIQYLATGEIEVTGVDFSKLDFSNLSSFIVDLDALYTEFNNNTVNGNMPASYRGYSSFERARYWMLTNPASKMRCPMLVKDGDVPFSVTLENVRPDAFTQLSWDSGNFAATSYVTTMSGDCQYTIHPAVDFPSGDHDVGSHTLSVAVANTGGLYDVLEQTIVYQRKTHRKGSTILKYAAADTLYTADAIHHVSFTEIGRNDAGLATTPWDRIVIPASLNGRKVRLRVGMRLVPSATGEYSIACGVQKNGQPATTNTLVSGLGVPSNRLASGSQPSGIIQSHEFSLTSAVLEVATNDYFQVYVYSKFQNITVQASNYTFFELEVVE